MNKFLFGGTVLSILILPLAAPAQSTKQMTVTNTEALYQEVYSVLASKPSTKQGNYRGYHVGRSRQLLVSGYYTNGQKDSLWTEFHPWSKQVWARGRYRKDRPMGVWEYYTLQGVLEQKFDHSRQRLAVNQPHAWGAKVSFKPLVGTMDSSPVYIGGFSGIMRVISRNVQYPKLALRNQVEGSVQVVFSIDANGKTSNHRVVKELGAGCDEEALRVVKLIPDSWVPAQEKGRPVAAECVVPISFRITD